MRRYTGNGNFTNGTRLTLTKLSYSDECVALVSGSLASQTSSPKTTSLYRRNSNSRSEIAVYHLSVRYEYEQKMVRKKKSNYSALRTNTIIHIFIYFLISIFVFFLMSANGVDIHTSQMQLLQQTRLSSSKLENVVYDLRIIYSVASSILVPE